MYLMQGKLLEMFSGFIFFPNDKKDSIAYMPLTGA